MLNNPIIIKTEELDPSIINKYVVDCSFISPLTSGVLTISAQCNYKKLTSLGINLSNVSYYLDEKEAFLSDMGTSNNVYLQSISCDFLYGIPLYINTFGWFAAGIDKIPAVSDIAYDISFGRYLNEIISVDPNGENTTTITINLDKTSGLNPRLADASKLSKNGVWGVFGRRLP